MSKKTSIYVKRINWSSVISSIHKTRSRRALFFKPVCVIAAIDLADAGLIDKENVDANVILDRFYDYVEPIFEGRGNDGYQPLWSLANDNLWSFIKNNRFVSLREVADSRPSTRNKLLEKFDKIVIHDGIKQLWDLSDKRRVLRDQMLLMLYDGDKDSRKMVPPLFDHKNVNNKDLWPTKYQIENYLKILKHPSLFDEEYQKPEQTILNTEYTNNNTASNDFSKNIKNQPKAVENTPSPINYIWSYNKIVVDKNFANQPLFSFASARVDHEHRLEVCMLQAKDLLQDIARKKWQLREDYKIQIERYIERLPKSPGSGNILLADAATRILRDIFYAEQLALPPPFAAGLKALLQQHIALRPFYPEIENFYKAVKTGRIDEPLPLDAVDNAINVVKEQTPAIFDESVSEAIAETSASEPDITIIVTDVNQIDGIISPPPDPIGELDKKNTHDFQIASVFNNLWRVFTSAEKVSSNTEAWLKTYNSLSDPMEHILNWLRNFVDR